MNWKICPLNSNYLISEDGQVKNKHGRILKPWKVHGYLTIKFGFKSKNYLIHRLVALCFIPNPDNKEQINHKDGNKLNNHVSNLEWATRSENCQHSYDNNLSIRRFGHSDSQGIKNSQAILNEDQIKEIRYKYETGLYSYEKLAKEYNTKFQNIHCIIKRKSWKHI